jgi:membrane-associated phospholipid phosphatase
MATTAATLLEPSATATDDAADHDAAHPHRRSLIVAGTGWLAITTVLLGVGMLLTHVLTASVGEWDAHVNAWLANHRTPIWNDITKYATASFNTTPVVVGSILLVGFLALRHHLREAAFIALALLIEITAFLSVTFVVARPRPDVVRLNSTPSTSSFPSGHTAAATVLFVGLAIIVSCCTTRTVVRAATGVLAVVVTAAVGFARVYRGLHHPTDVFVGALFGLACLAVAALTVRAHGDAWRAVRTRDGTATAPVPPLARPVSAGATRRDRPAGWTRDRRRTADPAPR